MDRWRGTPPSVRLAARARQWAERVEVQVPPYRPTQEDVSALERAVAAARDTRRDPSHAAALSDLVDGLGTAFAVLTHHRGRVEVRQAVRFEAQVLLLPQLDRVLARHDPASASRHALLRFREGPRAQAHALRTLAADLERIPVSGRPTVLACPGTVVTAAGRAAARTASALWSAAAPRLS